MTEQILEGFDPAIAQFRLSRIQLVNWGPFHGYTPIDVHRDGTLITGPSGAGKSTLLDAVICVLMDRTVTFNAAAHDEAVGSKERTFYSYVRGKTGSQRDESRGTRAIYLRERATWSAVALTWQNRAGKTVTACRAMQVGSDGTTDHDITHALMICEDDLDLRLLEPVVEHRLRQDAIRRALPNVSTYGNEYGRYVARLAALVGIRGQDGDSAKAIRLLHKAQSSKGVQNIDDTFKRFVLDDSKVGLRRDTAVEQFMSLRNGYEEMVRARGQIELLSTLPELWERYVSAGEQSRELRDLVDSAHGTSPVETYLLGVRKDLLTARAEHERAEHERHRAESSAAKAEYTALADGVRALEQQRFDGGGTVVDQLDRELATLAAQEHRTATARESFDAWCELLDQAPPQDADELAALQERRPLHDKEDPAQTATRYEHIAAVERLRTDLDTLRGELASFENRTSNIPEAYLRVRGLIAHGTGLTDADLPFVGELVDVDEGEEEWRTAAERLLGGLGLHLLVDTAHYRDVARFVDSHDLRARVRYSPVDTDAVAESAAPTPGTMAAKITVAESRFGPWVAQQLVRTASHQCVRDSAELAVLREAVTLTGQVKHRSGLHEKDDRADARRHRVLGFDNEQTRRDLREAIAALEEAEPALLRAREQAEAQRDRRATIARAWASVFDTAWEDIDVAAVRERADAVKRRRDEVADGDAIAALDREIADLTDRRDRANHRARSAAEASSTAQKAWAQRADEEDRLSRRLDELGDLPAEQVTVLAACAAECDPDPDLDGLRSLEKSMRNLIGQRVTSQDASHDHARGAIAAIMTEFLHRWPDEAGTYTTDLTETPAYLRRLDDLRRDDLPAAMTQWRQLMHNINTMGLTSLIQTLRDERLVIDDRIDPINDVLRTVPFGHDGYLQIVTTDREPPASRQFKAEIDAILENTLGQDLDDAELETRFRRISRLMDRLDSTDPLDRDWQREVLDVKRHVRISAEEHRRSEKRARVYEGVGATSGGEGQELIAATLGAALRYQLGGIEQVPVFGSVMVDEGFVKSDPDVTRRAIRALQSFGFQLLIAAPIDKYQSMEREFGSAYLIEQDPAAGRAYARGFAIGFGPTGSGDAPAA